MLPPVPQRFPDLLPAVNSEHSQAVIPLSTENQGSLRNFSPDLLKEEGLFAQDKKKHMPLEKER